MIKKFWDSLQSKGLCATLNTSVKYILSLLRKRFFPTNADKWFSDEGDALLRANYPELDSDSTVFDVGGYVGDFVEVIYDKYESKIFVFEPVSSFAEQIKTRFEGNSQITCFQFGLTGDKTHDDEISVDGNASSTETKSATTKEKILMVNINEFLIEHQIEQIDLLKINIEGGEYSLLNALIESPYINKVKNIQVQFHSFVPDAKAKMEHIWAELTKTHKLTWQYIFVWENWKLRE